MVTYTVKEAYAIHEAMSAFIQSGRNLSGKAGLVFTYNFRLIHEATGEYITRRDEIITKYADPVDEKVKAKNDEAGIITAPTITDPDRLAKANKEIEEFSSLKIEIPIMEISVDDLMNNKDIDSFATDILLPFCTEFNADKKKIKKSRK